MAFDFPTAPAINDEYTLGGILYQWDGTVWGIKGGSDPQDYILRAGDIVTGTLTFDARPPAENAIVIQNDVGNKTLQMSGSSSTHTGILEFYANDGTTRRGYIGYGDANHLTMTAEGAVEWRFNKSVKISTVTPGNGYFIGDNWHGMYFDGSNTMVFSEYHNRFEWRSQTSGAPGADIGTIAMTLYGGVLGPAVNHNVSFQNGFTGTMDFRVNPAMVTLRILNVKTTNAQTGVTQHVKICDYPTGVPAPWGNLYVHIEGCSDTSFTFLGRHAMVSAQTGGVFLSMYGGSTPEDFPANTYFSCTITWSR